MLPSNVQRPGVPAIRHRGSELPPLDRPEGDPVEMLEARLQARAATLLQEQTFGPVHALYLFPFGGGEPRLQHVLPGSQGVVEAALVRQGAGKTDHRRSWIGRGHVEEEDVLPDGLPRDTGRALHHTESDAGEHHARGDAASSPEGWNIGGPRRRVHPRRGGVLRLGEEGQGRVAHPTGPGSDRASVASSSSVEGAGTVPVEEGGRRPQQQGMVGLDQKHGRPLEARLREGHLDAYLGRG